MSKAKTPQAPQVIALDDADLALVTAGAGGLPGPWDFPFLWPAAGVAPPAGHGIHSSLTDAAAGFHSGQNSSSKKHGFRFA
jgi:hypothetical protein